LRDTQGAGSSRDALAMWRDTLQRLIAELRRWAMLISGFRLDAPLLLGLIALNLISAVLALVLSSPLALVGWLISGLWLAFVVWPQRPTVATEQLSAPVEESTIIIEPEERDDARSIRAPVLIVALLIVVLGQLLIAANAPGESDPLPIIGDIADSIGDSLQLRINDQSGALIGLALLAVGAIVFGRATRHVAIEDRPAMRIEAHPSGARSRGGWIVLVALGLGAWLLVLQLVADGAIGLGPAALWLTALGLLAFVWRRIDLDRGVRWQLDWTRNEVYALLALIVAAFAVWLLQLDRLPASIWGDEGAYWTTARDFVSGVAPVNLFGFGTYNFPAGGTIYQALVIGVLGQSVMAWRAASVLAVLAAMPPLYVLVRETLGRRVAFVALAFYATSPLLLAYGRIGYHYALAILPVVSAAALIVLAIRMDSRLLAFLAGVASGSGFMFYPSARFGFVLCLLFLVAFAFARMGRGAALLRLGSAFLAALFISAGPALAFGFGREPEAFVDKLAENSMANVLFAQDIFGQEELFARATLTSTRNNRLFFEPSLYVTLMLRGMTRTAIAVHRDGLVNEHYVAGALSAPVTLLYVMGAGWCLARMRRPGYAIWPIWLFAGTFVLSAIETFPPHTSDLLPVAPAWLVLAALGLVSVIDTLRGMLGVLPSRMVWGALVAATLVLSALGLRGYFLEMPQRYRPNLEMAMFWSTFDMPRGATLAFVRDDAYPSDFVPWGLRNFDTGINWVMLDAPALRDSNFGGRCAIDCRVFYTPATANDVEAALRASLSVDQIATYSNSDGQIIGYGARVTRQP
jgi:4-amino-4-deoxy-L-arabinose transferase-like glycosyltransferase